MQTVGTTSQIYTVTLEFGVTQHLIMYLLKYTIHDYD